MIVCPNCQKELPDGTKFCSNCGSIIPDTVLCPNCGNQARAGAAFCPICGMTLAPAAPVQQPAAPAAPEQAAYAAPAQPDYYAAAPVQQPYYGEPVQQPYYGAPVQQPAEKKKFPKKLFIFGGIGLAAVILLAVIIALIAGGGGSAKDYSLYIKDKEIFFTDLSKGGWQLTSRFVEDNGVDNADLDGKSYSIGKCTYLGEDGKTIFFPDKVSEDDNGFTLYYKSIKDPEAEAIKIDSEITSYYVNDATTLVTYLKGGDRVLWQYNIKKDDKEKIAGDVSSYQVSADGKSIGYLNEENSMYLKVAGEDKEKLDSDVKTIYDISEDFSTVIYKKDDALYKLTIGNDREKIASEFYTVLKVYDSGEVYFLKSETNEVALKDYVIDDLQPSESSYLRERLAAETYSQKNYILYYYDGQEAEKVADSFVYSWYSDYVFAADTPMVIYQASGLSSIDKVKLSEIDSIYDVSDMIDDAQEEAADWYIATGSIALQIEDLNDATSFRIDSAGKTAYYIDDIPEDKNYGDLYRMEISGGKPEKAERYDTDVYTGTMGFIDGEQFLYTKEYKDGKCEVYVDKNRIDYDVNLQYMDYDKEENVFVYFTDYNSEKEYGTLKIYKKGEAVKIADDVHEFELLPNGSVLYLNDYSQKYCRGTLYLYKSGKSEKIDEDVVCILPLIDTKSRGSSISW